MPQFDAIAGARVGMTLLAVSEVPNFLAGMLPSLMTIKRFGAEEEDRATLRRGEVAGSLLALGVGAGASLVVRDPMPFVGTVVVLGIMLYMYEDAIRNPHRDARPINDQPGIGVFPAPVVPNITSAGY